MKIAIAGFGVEGKASYDYFLSSSQEVTIVDEKQPAELPNGADTMIGKGVFSNLYGFDMVIRSPGVAPDRIKTDGKIWSSTNEFFAKCQTPIIGVTGTKGKGTTASLINSILQANSKNTVLVGNIGVPALSALEQANQADYVVFELSSFQLWDIERSPHIAVLLGIEPDHLDVHSSMDDYVTAKSNITHFQTRGDILVFNSDNDYSRQIAEQSPAERRPYPFEIGRLADSLRLPGRHNQENASAAIAALRGIVEDAAMIKQGLASFDGLPHRLKFVRKVGGVSFFDDSIATTPGSAIAAIRSFTEPKVIILGGSNKGADYHEIVNFCSQTTTSVIAIGETGRVIKMLCDENDVRCEYVSGLMDEAVSRSMQLLNGQGVVILSPASASFDQYQNYRDRGEQFIAAVSEIDK